MRYNTELYKPSFYNIFIPLTNGTLVYNGMGDSLEKLTLKEKDVYDLISQGKSNADVVKIAGNERFLSKVMEKFLNARVIILRKSTEKELFDKALYLLRNKKDSFGVTIAPTMACNFVCDYCFQGQHGASQPMNKAVQDRVIDFIEKKLEGKKHFSVSWYGGEPLMALEVIESLSKRILAICKKNECKYRASIVTNGFFLTREVAQRLVDCQVSSVQITIDGDQESHDNRRYIKGHVPTFAKIIENLCSSVELEQLYFSIRVNIDKRNYGNISKLLDFLHDKNITAKDNLEVYFAPVDLCTEECLNISEEVLNKVSYSELEACLIQKAMTLHLYKLHMPARIFSLCGAILPNSFVILPNGDLHKCWNTVANHNEKVGNINHPDEIAENAIYRDWISRPLIKSEECYQCPILANCAGGCAAKKGNNADSCISLKNNIRQRLVMYALYKQIITESEVL